MTARQLKFSLSEEQWNYLCSTLPDLRNCPIARSLLDDRITRFRTFCRADEETNTPNATKTKLAKLEAAAKKLRNEWRSLDVREKISLARLAAPGPSSLLLDNMREFSSLFDGLDRVEKAARRAIEATKRKKSGADAGNRTWLVEQLDRDLEYFGIKPTSQGNFSKIACAVLQIADPEGKKGGRAVGGIKDGSRIVRGYLKEKGPRDAEAKAKAKDKQERDDAFDKEWGLILPPR